MLFMGKLSSIIGIAALAGIGYYVGKKVFDKKKADDAIRAEKIAAGELDESSLFVEEQHTSPKEKLQKASLFAVGAIKTGTEKFKEGIDEIINADMVSKGETTVSEVKTFAAEKKEQATAFVNEKKEKASSFVSEKKEQAATFVNEKKEQAAAFVSDTTNNIKNEIDNLKNMVSSINTAPGEASEEDVIDIDGDIFDEEIEAENSFNETSEEIPETDEASVKLAEGENIEKFSQEPADISEADNVVEELADIVEEEVEAATEEVAEFMDDLDKNDSEDLDDISFDSTETVDTFDFGAADKL